MPYLWTEENLAYWKKTLALYDLSPPTQLNALRKELLIAQNYKCALCGVSLDGGRIAYLDHDHHSGAIRGMLCMRCNRFWVAKNTTESSLAVVRYLANPPAYALLPDLLKKVKRPSIDP